MTALMTRAETAKVLAVSISILAKSASDTAFGTRAEKNGVLPPVACYVSNRAMYLADDVARCLETREVAALAGRLRARKIL